MYYYSLACFERESADVALLVDMTQHKQADVAVLVGITQVYKPMQLSW